MSKFSAIEDLPYDIKIEPAGDEMITKYALAKPRKGKIRTRTLRVVKTRTKHWCWITKEEIPAGTLALFDKCERNSRHNSLDHAWVSVKGVDIALGRIRKPKKKKKESPRKSTSTGKKFSFEEFKKEHIERMDRLKAIREGKAKSATKKLPTPADILTLRTKMENALEAKTVIFEHEGRLHTAHFHVALLTTVEGVGGEDAED